MSEVDSGYEGPFVGGFDGSAGEDVSPNPTYNSDGTLKEGGDVVNTGDEILPVDLERVHGARDPRDLGGIPPDPGQQKAAT
jgi:hypothetical protein